MANEYNEREETQKIISKIKIIDYVALNNFIHICKINGLNKEEIKDFLLKILLIKLTEHINNLDI